MFVGTDLKHHFRSAAVRISIEMAAFSIENSTKKRSFQCKFAGGVRVGAGGRSPAAPRPPAAGCPPEQLGLHAAARASLQLTRPGEYSQKLMIYTEN